MLLENKNSITRITGITCLQLATKNEEIYPPKMAEYAYVTDGACSESEIISKEIVICKVRMMNV